MHQVIITKGNGKSRLIYVPNRQEKATLRSLVSEIAKKALKASPEGVCHGFVHERSPVTNAIAHVGHAFTLCFDLKDFFESVTPDKLSGKISSEVQSLVFVDGAARQGLPTSPAVANLAAASMDHAIIRFRDKRKIQFVYTRYADDLSFSYDDPDLSVLLLKEIPLIVRRCGFAVNEQKTKLQASSSGRRVVTGIGVDDAIHPTREMKRRLRAAIHQGHKNQARGLEEWCRLTPPKARVVDGQTADEIRRLCKTWRLPLDQKKLPVKAADEILGEAVVITSDPVYTLGMSTWTTGWTSCMSQPNGQFRKGVLFWCFLRGTRVACLLSDKTKTVSGVERRLMRARTLVHELRDGRKVYDRVYGNPGDTRILETELQRNGYVSVAATSRNSTRVVGHAPVRYKPYLDSLHASQAIATEGPWKGQQVRFVHV